MNYWDAVEAAQQIIVKPMVAKRHIDLNIESMNDFMALEGIGASIQKAAMDWLSTVFRNKGSTEVRDLLQRNTDDLYASWTKYAEEVHGIASLPAQESGWEMIMDGGLLELPGGDRYY